MLLNGRVITVDAADHVRQAVAIGGDKILAVGTNDEIKKLIGPATQQVDLHGLTVTPGLLDAHAHFAQAAPSRLFTLDLSYPEVKNLADVRTKLAERVAHAAPGDWVNGKGWDEGKLTERRYIHAADIDAVSPNNPVRLTHTTGHYIVVNTAAMKLSNITKDTPDPPGGTIDRYPDGSPTGVFKENATRLVRSGGGRGSGLPADATEQGIRELAKAFNAEGMTGAKDPGDRDADLERVQEGARGRRPDRAHLHSLVGREPAVARGGSHRADRVVHEAVRIHRRRSSRERRHQALHRRQRRRGTGWM